LSNSPAELEPQELEIGRHSSRVERVGQAAVEPELSLAAFDGVLPSESRPELIRLTGRLGDCEIGDEGPGIGHFVGQDNTQSGFLLLGNARQGRLLSVKPILVVMGGDRAVELLARGRYDLPNGSTENDT
jgi:hypothetical protein